MFVFQASLQSKESTAELFGSTSLLPWLLSFDDNVKDSTSKAKLIIENDGQNPYYQFGSRIGGLPISEEDINLKQQGRRVSLSDNHVPDLLPIHLPSGEDNPLSVASPKSKKKIRHSPADLNGATRPSIQNLSSTNKSAPSEAVEQLLAKIPDLSFMLESKLVLPTK